MTQQKDILNDEKYLPVLNHGFVGLVDFMGNDSSIVQAARVSYGDGTKSVSEDRSLIRYLMRHLHTTPMEMVTIKFHCKMPIFIARQWIRHRTASVNEYSGRYSVMVDEFYVPELEHILPQSTTNNQGRGGNMSTVDQQKAQNEIIRSNTDCYIRYQNLLGEASGENKWPGIFSEDFEGISREMARGVLSVNNYTEWYWSINLHNLFHFLALRMDSHAQWEIQQFANTMYKIIKPIVPLASEAFEDYRLNSHKISRMETELLRFMLSGRSWDVTKANYDGEEGIIKHFGLSKRELIEFKEKFNLN